MTSSEKIKVILHSGKTECNFAYDSVIEERAADIAGMLVDVGDFEDDGTPSIRESDLAGARIAINVGKGVKKHDLPLRVLVTPPRDFLFLPISLPSISLEKTTIKLAKPANINRCIIFTFFFKK